MLAEQRSAPPPLEHVGGGLWLDEELGSPVADRAQLHYVVVDELIDDVAVVVIAPWPTYDDFGRLEFGAETDRGEVGLDGELFHARVVEERRVRNHDAAARPLRIGDAFRVTTRSPDAGLTDPAVTTEDLLGMIERIEDVSHWARDAAKMAFYAAVSPRLDPETVNLLGMFDDDPDATIGAEGPNPGPTATPAV